MRVIDIAKHFQVTPGTVSNALNFRNGVNEKLAEEIRRYAQQVGYMPNRLARALLSGSSNVIGLCLCEAPSSPWFGELLCQLQNKLSEHGFYVNTIVLDAMTNEKDFFRKKLWALNFFSQIKADAILFGPCDFQTIRELQTQYPGTDKLIGFDALDELDICHCGLKIKQGMQLALEHLFQNGHRKIGYVGLNRFDAESLSPNTRYAVYQQELKRRELPLKPDWIIKTNRLIPSDEMLQDLKRCLNTPDRPTAFFCHSDNYAAITVKAIQECGLDMPADISVIGFDNQPISWLSCPGFSTIRFDQQNYVEKIVEMTLNSIKEKTEFRSYFETPVLVNRGSVRKI